MENFRSRESIRTGKARYGLQLTAGPFVIDPLDSSDKRGESSICFRQSVGQRTYIIAMRPYRDKLDRNFKKGFDFYKKNIREFSLYQNYPGDENSLSYNDVDCLTEDSKGISG